MHSFDLVRSVPAPTFDETQRFESWLYALVIIPSVPVPLLLWSVMGPRGAVIGIVTVLLPVAVLAFARLETELRDDGVYIRFVPFHFQPRRIPFAEIESVDRVRLSSLNHGIHWTREGWKYTAAGSTGVRIRREERDVFVGSERPDDLVAAIRAAMGHKQSTI